MRPEHRQQAVFAALGIAVTTSLIVFATSTGLARFFPAAILLFSGCAAALLLAPRADEGLPPHPPAPNSPPGEPTVPESGAWTPREIEILELIAQGCSNTEIAAELVISHSTVKTHINNLYRKLAVRSRVQALSRARALQLVS
ncbi:MAG: response regulator transcription factor [Chloroflexi bacterium]|nr:response regulator transcription factor [Chloroflexota bacterium]